MTRQRHARAHPSLARESTGCLTAAPPSHSGCCLSHPTIYQTSLSWGASAAERRCPQDPDLWRHAVPGPCLTRARRTTARPSRLASRATPSAFIPSHSQVKERPLARASSTEARRGVLEGQASRWSSNSAGACSPAEQAARRRAANVMLLGAGWSRDASAAEATSELPALCRHSELLGLPLQEKLADAAWLRAAAECGGVLTGGAEASAAAWLRRNRMRIAQRLALAVAGQGVLALWRQSE